jgi:protein involved in polysaccharide export with SLBB domain
LVKVSGEVFYPTIIPIKTRKNAKYYVKQAGGFMSSSRKSKTLIIYPNGKVLPVKSFLWFNFYPKIKSRAEIFVPQKNRDNKNRLGTGELALIVSALGILANVVLTAVKN